MKNYNQDNGLMLIVDTQGDSVEVPEAEAIEETLHTELHVDTSTTTATTTEATTTTTTTTTAMPTTEPTSTTEHSKSDMTVDFKNLPVMLNLLKQLSIIPAVVKTFAGTPSGPSPLFASSSDVRYSPTDSRLHSSALDQTHGYAAKSPSFVQAPPFEAEAPVNLIGRRDKIPNMAAPIVPVNSQPKYHPIEQRMSKLNIYGIDSFPTTESKAYEAPTTISYPVEDNRRAAEDNYDRVRTEDPHNKVRTSGEGQGRRQKPMFDISNLTIAEVEQLENIHRKLFKTEEGNLKIHSLPPSPSTTAPDPPIYIFDKPKNPDKADNHNMGDVASSLSPSELNELMMIKDLPDLEDLTKGMDLSLLSKPGGFAQLKQQFIERIVNRSIQLRRYAYKMN
ncbi:unnamed protein product [Bursaphelenchus okinawaensis]|uniref:Uncharacterized protein n=1 Tax=Bursaphelenchus okinawaensis TaxID=465554 RepID=A0A811KJT3_9BILA|nr:unnamed protein product [Bursaphelenchus okinawaensis]CAG9104314.1 unnamed protein product [Bursaphelenchus okinawaensis]